MTFSKKIHFLKKKKTQTFIRSGKLFCKFQDFFKSPRPYTNPGWLFDVNLSHSYKFENLTSGVTEGKIVVVYHWSENQNPIYYLKSQFQSPKHGCKGLKLVSKMARRNWSTNFHLKHSIWKNRTTFSDVPVFPEIFH